MKHTGVKSASEVIVILEMDPRDCGVFSDGPFSSSGALI
jgi:hypothetical protein